MEKISLAFVLFFGLAFGQAEAQFEGKIQVQDYEIKSGEKVKDDDAFTLYITPDRILFQGDQEYTVSGNIKTEGILVRHKEQDFVLMTGEKTAMSITKSGITTFMNMFGSDAKKGMNKAESNIEIEKSGDRKKINGYAVQKFIITDKESPELRSEVWMTQDLDINWGVLASSWGENMKGFSDSDLPFNLIFDEGYFPVQWEQYKNGNLTDIIETEITSTDVARSMVQIGPDVQIMSLQDYLFQQVRNNN